MNEKSAAYQDQVPGGSIENSPPSSPAVNTTHIHIQTVMQLACEPEHQLLVSDRAIFRGSHGQA